MGSPPNTVHVRLDSDQGRIGPLWWVNSDQQPGMTIPTVTRDRRGLRSIVTRKAVRWGTFGIGRNIRIAMDVAS